MTCDEFKKTITTVNPVNCLPSEMLDVAGHIATCSQCRSQFMCLAFLAPSRLSEDALKQAVKDGDQAANDFGKALDKDRELQEQAEAIARKLC